MAVFGCASDEQFHDELVQENVECQKELAKDKRPWCPCDDCELTYINQCASCQFASPLINDSLNYKDDEDWQ